MVGMNDWWSRLSVDPVEPLVGDLPRAAVLAALFEDEQGDVRMILTKRPDTMPTHAGHIAFPGGRPEPEDSGPVDTALREAHEEVGIDPASVDVLGFLSPIHTVEFALMVVPVVGRLAGIPVLRPSEREVARVHTPRLDELSNQDSWRSEMWGSRRLWFFDLDGDLLWGATAWMVRDLLGLGD